MTEKAAFKDENEQLSKLSRSGKENTCLFPVELNTGDRERVEPITQEPETDRNTCKSSKALASGGSGLGPRWTPGPLKHSRPCPRENLLYSPHTWAFKEEAQKLSDFLKVTWIISKFWISVLAPGAVPYILTGTGKFGIHPH